MKAIDKEDIFVTFFNISETILPRDKSEEKKFKKLEFLKVLNNKDLYDVILQIERLMYKGKSMTFIGL